MIHSLSSPASRRAAGAPLILFAAFASSLIVGGSIVSADLMTVAIAIAAPLVILGTFVDVRFILYALVFAMLLSPEVEAGNTARRALTLRLEDVLIPLALVGILARRVLRPERELIGATVLIPIVAVSIARVLSTGMAVYDEVVFPKAAWLFVLKTIEYFVLFFVALNGPKSRGDSDRLLVSMVITAFVVAALASAGIGSGERLSAPFEGEKPEPNTLGGYLAFMIALLSGFALFHPSHRVRVGALGSIFCLGVPLLFTLSRSSYLAILAIGGILVLIRKRLTLALGLVAALAAVALVAPHSVRERVTSTAQVVEGPFQTQVMLEGSAASKLNIWIWFRIAYETRPFLGWGMTGAGLVDSEYPRVFAEGGIIGLLAFLWLIIELVRLGVAGIRSKEPGTRALGVGFTAGLFGLLTHAVGANTFLIVRIMEPFWFAAGLLAFRLRIDRQESKEQR